MSTRKNNHKVFITIAIVLSLIVLASVKLATPNATITPNLTSQWAASEAIPQDNENSLIWHTGNRAMLGLTKRHLLFDVQFNAPKDKQYLVVAPTYLDIVNVDFFQADGQLLSQVSKGDKLTYNKQNYINDVGHFVFHIPPNATSARLNISATESLQASITVENELQLSQNLLFSNLFKSAILTIIALASVTALAISVHMQQRLYAIFGLHQLVWFCVLLAFSGLIPRLWPALTQVNGTALGFFTILATLSGSIFHWHILNHIMQKKWLWLGGLFKITITFTVFNLFIYLVIDESLGLLLNAVTSTFAMAILITVLPIINADDRLQSFILNKVKWPYVLLVLLALLASLARLGIGNGVHMSLLYVHALFSMLLLAYIILLRSIVLRRREASMAIKTKIQAASITQLSNSLNEQSALLSMLSHEIKTPLTTLKLLIFKSPIRESLNYQLASIEHIVDTVTFMDSVKKDTHVSEQLDLQSLIETQWQQCVGLTGSDKKLSLETHGNPICLANRWALSIVFNNLIANAQKYGTSGIIEIAIYQQPNNIQVVVKNKSVDLSSEERKALTNKYFRASNKAGHRGTGLGLWISKTLSESNNCNLRVSQGDGEFIATVEILI